jgi:hypothetical protein
MVDKIKTMFLLLFLFLLLPAHAGNRLPTQQFAVDSAQKQDYYLTQPTILFDQDIEPEVIYKALIEVNDKLEDIQLTYTVSDTDYDHAAEYAFNWYQPDRIFVHLGRGIHDAEFSAILRSYTDQPGTCLIYLKKDLWLSKVVTINNKTNILKHELYHCLGWDHSFITNDLEDWDNVEVLKRLYDKDNKIKAKIVKTKGTTFFFNKRYKRKAATRDNQIKLIPGKYRSTLTKD